MIGRQSDYNISIGFSTTRLFISRIIRWATRSSCSHAFIAFDDAALKMRMVMQAEAWGYELRPWKRWIRHNTLVAEFRPVGPRLDEALRETATRLGTKFDYWSAFIIGIKSLFQSWSRNRYSLNLNQSPWKLTCSEAVVRFLMHGGYTAVKRLDPETTSPGSLLRAVLASKKEFEALFLKLTYLRFDRSLTIEPKIYKKSVFLFNKKRDSLR
ncbi:MAG: hypothetical protein A2176_13875 [Spirochaetes bacterium RBG_13_51_14]|nr:MAG: hypothetical protein A2176_13875 [Spirochaetes bacterium RBG_13_51_14]